MKVQFVLLFLCVVAAFNVPQQARAQEVDAPGSFQLHAPDVLHPNLSDRPAYHDQAGNHFRTNRRRPNIRVNWESGGVGAGAAFQSNTATRFSGVAQLNVAWRSLVLESSNYLSDMSADAMLGVGADAEMNTVVGFRAGTRIIMGRIMNPNAVGSCTTYFGASMEYLLNLQGPSRDARQNVASIGVGPAAGVICSDPDRSNKLYLILGGASRITGALRGDRNDGQVEGAGSVDVEANLHVIAEDMALRSDLTWSFWSDATQAWRWRNAADWTIGAPHGRFERRDATYYLVGIESVLGTMIESSGRETPIIEARAFANVHFR